MATNYTKQFWCAHINTKASPLLTSLHRWSYDNFNRPNQMTHFVARNGDVFESDRDPSSFDTHCYQKEGFGRICLLPNDQTEIDFLTKLGEDLHLKFVGLNPKS